MKKIITLFVLLFAVVALVACGKIEVSEVNIKNTETTIEIGENLTLEVEVLPEDATDKEVTFSSDKPEFATVSTSGVVLGVAEGDVVITATAGEKSDTISLTVVPEEVEEKEVTSVELTFTATSLDIDDTLQATVVVLPSDAPQTVTYSSSKLDVATVSDTGLVTALKAGEVVITATAGGKSDSVTLTVNEEEVIIPDVTSVELSFPETSVEKGETLQATVIVLPELAVQTVTYLSSDEAVATITEDGLLTALEAGTVTITATAGGKSDSVTLTVNEEEVIIPDVTSVELSFPETSVEKGETLQATVIVLPELAVQTVTYLSSDEAVATITEDGLLTALEAGTVTITATAGGKSDSVTLTVNEEEVIIPDVTSVELSFPETSVEKGETLQATVIVLPELAVQTVTYLSSDEAVATITEDGLLTALEAGTVTITATAGGKSDSVTLTVNEEEVIIPDVTSVELSFPETSVEKGETLQATVIVLPELAVQTVTYLSSDEAVATITEDGLLTALEAGTVTITATAGGKSDSVTLTVNEEEVIIPDVTSVELSFPETSVEKGETLQATVIVLPELAVQTVTYLSSDEAVATITEDGLLTALEAGTVTITATAGGKSDSVTLTVNEEEVIIPDVTSVELSFPETSVEKGETLQATVIVLPELAVQTVTYLSSDEAVATITEDGLLTALEAGTVTITATAGGKSDSVTLTVNEEEVIIPDVTSVELSFPETSVEKGETLQATVIVLPELAVQTVTYLSSDEAVATITEDGLLTALEAGTVTIKVTAEGGLTDEAVIEVIDSSVITVDNLQSRINQLVEEYNSSLTGYIKMNASLGDDVLTTDFAYNYTEEGINELMYKQLGAVESHIFVKDQKVYMLEKSIKGQIALSASEATMLKQQYGITAFTSQMLDFITDESFFQNLSLDGDVEGVYTFSLNLETYDGTTFDLAGKDAISLELTAVDGEISKIELLIANSNSTEGKTSLEFLGLGVPEIPFPADLILYPAN